MSFMLFLRFVGTIVLGLGGWELGTFINGHNPPMEGFFWIILLAVCGAVIGFGCIPFPPHFVRRDIKSIPGHILFGALIGLIIALVISAILALPLSLLPDDWGKITPAVVCVILAYISITIIVIEVCFNNKIRTSPLSAPSI